MEEAGTYRFIGKSVLNEIHKITMVRPVAERLGLECKDNVEFYLVDGDVVIRKGEREYDPKNGRNGFYMGTSSVDVHSRITLIQLAVINLQLSGGDRVFYYIHNDEVVIRKAVITLDMVELLDQIPSEDKRTIATLLIKFAEAVEDFAEVVDVDNIGYSTRVAVEKVAVAVSGNILEDVPPGQRKDLISKAMTTAVEVEAESMTVMKRLTQSYLIAMGIRPSEERRYIEALEELSYYARIYSGM